MRIPPFEELQNGLPLWRIQVEDPSAAAALPASLQWRSLQLAHGPVIAVALSLDDGRSRPLLFHHALLPHSRGLAQLKRAGRLLLIFERHGFIGSQERTMVLDLSRVDEAQVSNPEALVDYVEGWRRELPRSSRPEEIWSAMEAAPATQASSSGLPLWAKLALAALAAALCFELYRLKGR